MAIAYFPSWDLTQTKFLTTILSKVSENLAVLAHSSPYVTTATNLENIIPASEMDGDFSTDKCEELTANSMILARKGVAAPPYSRGGDGRLTLKGGVREIIASETLARLGVNTSRCLSVIETGEQLWRGDEPSPTRSCVMVRLSQSHIRFGTFERLHYLRRKDLSKTLLDHVLEVYYPHIDRQQPQAYLQFYRELVDRTAQLAAQWMVAGFCHAVLNTDNMSITGESFDYGPYAFIPSYDPNFTAAYFDYYGRYSYGNQPLVCKLNLELLQQPLSGVTPDLTPEAMTEALQEFDRSYETAYRQGMLRRLGLPNLGEDDGRELVQLTVDILRDNDIGYHDFFSQLRQQFSPQWRDDPEAIFPKADPPHILQPLDCPLSPLPTNPLPQRTRTNPGPSRRCQPQPNPHPSRNRSHLGTHHSSRQLATPLRSPRSHLGLTQAYCLLPSSPCSLFPVPCSLSPLLPIAYCLSPPLPPQSAKLKPFKPLLMQPPCPQ